MKISNTTERLRYLMETRGLRQVDILEKCKPFCEQYGIKVTKSDLSQYVAGKTEPNQDKLMILALALNVKASWLMGFGDEQNTDKEKEPTAINGDELTPVKREAYNLISQMSDEDLERFIRIARAILGD